MLMAWAEVMNTCSAQVQLKRRVILMGSVFDITIVERDTIPALQRIGEVAEEVRRIENLISEWKPETQVSDVNRNAGIRPVKVDREVFELTRRAIAYSRMSGGAFDITTAAMDKVWKFDGSMTAVPSGETVRKSVEKVGYTGIVLDSSASTIFLTAEGMKIGFGSIGKGYAADRGRALMKQAGVKGGIVNASGDLSAWGTQADGREWIVGIGDPFRAGRTIRTLPVGEASLATSGSYSKYAEIEGKRYAHIIDPRTGYPATGLISVTIAGPSAELANALSTSVMVLGKQEGKKLVKRFPGYGYLVISDTGRRSKGGLRGRRLPSD